MEFVGTLSGSAPIIKKYQIAASTTIVGVPHLITASSGSGLAVATTTSLADAVGVNLDIATYVSAQQTNGTSAERTNTFVINPDAIYKVRLSGGAAAGTALPLQTVTTAASDGLVVTTAAEWSSPSMDEGSVWGYSGANVMSLRKITSVSTTAGTVIVPFDYDTVVGDVFLRAPVHPMTTVVAQLCTELTEIDATAAVSGASFLVIAMLHQDLAGDGRNKSYVLGVFGDHFLNRLS